MANQTKVVISMINNAKIKPIVNDDTLSMLNQRLSDTFSNDIKIYAFKNFSGSYVPVNRDVDGRYHIPIDALKNDAVYWINTGKLMYTVTVPELFTCKNEENESVKLGGVFTLSGKIEYILQIHNMMLKQAWPETVTLDDFMKPVTSAVQKELRRICDNYSAGKQLSYDDFVQYFDSEDFAKEANNALYATMYEIGLALDRHEGIKVEQLQGLPAKKKSLKEDEIPDFPVWNPWEEEPLGTQISQIPDPSRVLIGQDRQGDYVYWEFDHKELANRHLLLLGGTGYGKSYTIQTLMYELTKENVSSVVFDYSGSFTASKLEQELLNKIGGKIHQHIALTEKLHINPFRCQQIDVGGQIITESSIDVAARLADIFTHVYGFGEQQRAAVYDACNRCITQYGAKASFSALREFLADIGTSPAKSALSKMITFFDRDLFVTQDTDSSFHWESLLDDDGTIEIMQLQGMDQATQIIVTELLMWDAYYTFMHIGDKSKPFVAVFDEAQNLSVSDNSPAGKILREGRKYGWSAWFATQHISGTEEEKANLGLAGEVLYFLPNPTDVSDYAKRLSSRQTGSEEWKDILTGLNKGDCIVAGRALGADGALHAVEPRWAHITSLENRED